MTTTYKLKENLDLAYANAIRRIILNDIPNVAISSDVEFIQNNTPIHNEMMAHRISLIPVCLDIDKIHDFSPNDYSFEINVKNESSNIRIVTSKDIKVYDQDNKEYPKSVVSQMFPANPLTKDHILIMKLKKDEHLHAKFKAAKGTASIHSKWCPVSTVTYSFELDDELVNELRSKTPKEEMNKFETVDKYRLYKKDMETDNPSNIIFKIESECRMDGTYLINTAVQILKDKMKHILNNLVSKETDDNIFYVIKFKDESHTTLNVLQKIIIKHFVDKKTIVSYCGYYEEHPLNKEFILKLKFIKKTLNVEKFLTKCIDIIVEELQNNIIE